MTPSRARDERAIDVVPETAIDGQGAPARGQINICGIVIHLTPARAPALRAEIAGMTCVEIHADDGAARVVATVVDDGETLALEQIAAINRLPGVVSTSLVYHAFDIAD